MMHLDGVHPARAQNMGEGLFPGFGRKTLLETGEIPSTCLPRLARRAVHRSALSRASVVRAEARLTVQRHARGTLASGRRGFAVLATVSRPHPTRRGHCPRSIRRRWHGRCRGVALRGQGDHFALTARAEQQVVPRLSLDGFGRRAPGAEARHHRGVRTPQRGCIRVTGQVEAVAFGQPECSVCCPTLYATSPEGFWITPFSLGARKRHSRKFAPAFGRWHHAHERKCNTKEDPWPTPRRTSRR
jgi:hypothetical protein